MHFQWKIKTISDAWKIIAVCLHDDLYLVILWRDVQRDHFDHLIQFDRFSFDSCSFCSVFRLNSRLNSVLNLNSWWIQFGPHQIGHFGRWNENKLNRGRCMPIGVLQRLNFQTQHFSLRVFTSVGSVVLFPFEFGWLMAHFRNTAQSISIKSEFIIEFCCRKQVELPWVIQCTCDT